MKWLPTNLCQKLIKYVPKGVYSNYIRFLLFIRMKNSKKSKYLVNKLQNTYI